MTEWINAIDNPPAQFDKYVVTDGKEIWCAYFEVDDEDNDIWVERPYFAAGAGHIYTNVTHYYKPTLPK